MLFRAGAQNISLEDCFALARNNNLLIRQAGASLKAREYALQAEKQSYLPKVDLLAGYNYLSKPLEINLQQVKNGILEGSSRQAVNTANEVYKNITGNELSQNAQNIIYNGGKNILNTFYPDYNPALSKQQYFTAALGVRQPIWLGNKLRTVQDVAAAEVKAGRYHLDLAHQQVELLIALQYLRIMYLNNILQRQQQIIKSFERIEYDANEMVKQNTPASLSAQLGQHSRDHSAEPPAKPGNGKTDSPDRAQQTTQPAGGYRTNGNGHTAI